MTIEWIYALIGLIIGIASGVGLGYWLFGQSSDNTSVASIKKENEEFREQVTDHFVETAQLINQMTDSYKAVFDHLSGGADQLVDQKTLAERLPEITQREVRLKRIGAQPERKTAETDQAKKNPPASQPTNKTKAPITNKN